MTSSHPSGLPREEERRTEIGLFRYGLIAPLLHRSLEPGEMTAYLRTCAAHSHHIPYSRRQTLHQDTIWRYLARFREGGFEALLPKPRADSGCSRKLPETIIRKALALREELPSRSAQTIVEILRRDPEVPGELSLVPHTLSEILRRRGKPRQTKALEVGHGRRFQREHANDLWQGDLLVGPYLPDPERPGKFRRTALFCFIDDHSRLVPYGEFFFQETLPRLERVFTVAILRRGLPQAIYVDNGKVYVSLRLAAACATLGIRQIHSTPYVPNTRGKIERFFGTLRSQFLSEVEAAGLTTLADLNASFQAWLEVVYHQALHSETGQAPLSRFQESLQQRPVSSADALQLRQAFLWRDKRRVTLTATVSLQGNRYGVDPLLSGQEVELRYDPFDLAIMEVWQNGHFLAQAQVQNLQQGQHLSLDRLPSPAQEADGEHVDFLAALRAEHQSLLAKELGSISFAGALQRSGSKKE
jgi:putative transposase